MQLNPDDTNGTAKVKTDTMHANPDPVDNASAPEAVTPAEPTPPPKRTGRGRGGASAAAKTVKAKPLNDVDYQKLGELTAFAHRHKMSPADCIEHWKGLIVTWEKMESQNG